MVWRKDVTTDEVKQVVWSCYLIEVDIFDTVLEYFLTWEITKGN